MADGLYIEQTVVEETDYVVFPVLSIGASGRARPQVRIYDVSNAANVVTFIGPMFHGLHLGANNQATLQPTLPRWIADALIGGTVYNITDGSSAVITDNSETVVTGGLAGGTDNDWDTNDVFLIRFPRGYARWPWAESFCFQTPTGCTLLRVYIENFNSEGVLGIHQVQVMPNLLVNGDHETLTGANPDIITGWTNVGLDAGDTQSSAGGGAIIHSGAEAMQWNAGADEEGMQATLDAGLNEGDFYANYGWLYGEGTVGLLLRPFSLTKGHLQYDPAQRDLYGPVVAQWECATAVYRRGTSTASCQIRASSGATGARYSDDVAGILLNPITLTVTPASFINSQETTGLRIDGRDDVQQPIPVGYWGPTFGVAMWDWTPRHDDADAVAFGNTPSYVFWASAPIANYVLGRWTAANTMQVEVNDGAASNAVWNTGGGVVLAGTTYKMMLLFTGTNVFLFVDGVPRVTVAPAGGFNFGADIPTMMWWGAEPTPSLVGDATFARP